MLQGPVSDSCSADINQRTQVSHMKHISRTQFFFFLLSDDFCKEQDPHYFYLRPSCPVAMSSVNFYPNKIACSSEQSSPGVNPIPCHLFYITWNWILKLLLMLLVYWDHFWNNVLFSMSNSVGIWHLLGSKGISFTFSFLLQTVKQRIVFPVVKQDYSS